MPGNPRTGARVVVCNMALYLALAWGFVAFTTLLVLGVLYLWWSERHPDRS